MKVDIIKFKFHRPVHLSSGKEDSYESGSGDLRSDTFFAAMFYAAFQLFGEKVANDFKESCVFSSAFPFTNDGYYWLPKPLAFNLDHPERRKELKKIKYLRLDLFQRLQQGEKLTSEDLFLAPAPKLWERESSQRVVLDRVSRRGMPFFIEKWYPYGEIHNPDGHSQSVPYHHDRGLFMIYMTQNTEFPYLTNLLTFLSDTGIGLHKNLGNGKFSFEIEEAAFDLIIPDQVNHWINLSLFRPSKNELNSTSLRLDKSKYSIIKRGGWIASSSHSKFTSLRKKAVMMVSEGSTIRFTDESPDYYTIRGDLENVRPEWNDEDMHDVWRDGRSIFLPMA